MRIKADISDYVIGDVLSIKYEDEWWRLMVYLSNFLSEIEKNY